MLDRKKDSRISALHTLLLLRLLLQKLLYKAISQHKKVFFSIFKIWRKFFNPNNSFLQVVKFMSDLFYIFLFSKFINNSNYHDNQKNDDLKKRRPLYFPSLTMT